MKSPALPSLDPSVLAVLHRSGRAWNALLINRAGAKPAITASREFPLDQADRIDRWLTEQRAGSVLCVLPAAAVICRTVPLPDAPAEQLDPALRLQAEAHLLGIAPPHRVAMAVLPASAGETTRAGLVLAWPESAEFLAPVTSLPVRYIPDVAALAALINGHRPTEPLLWLDRGDGSVAVALTHSGGATFRATREEADTAEAWQKSVGRIVAETGLGVGHTGAFIENMVQEARARAATIGSKDAALSLPQEIRESVASRLAGASDEPAWWNANGIAAGAAIAATGALAALGGMLHTPPVQRPSRIRNSLAAMSRPRAAATIVAGSVLLLMFAPLAFSALRLLALKVRYGDVQQQLTVARASRDQIAVYQELEKQKTWPMTKLLSDIVTNAPLGIELEIMRVDAGKDFSISGTAIANGGKMPPEIVAQMVANLRADGIFVDPSLSWGDANNLGVYKFDVTGKVARPFLAANYPPERDFRAWTHADRRDGKPMPKAGAPVKPADTAVVDAGSAAGASGRNPTADNANAARDAAGESVDATDETDNPETGATAMPVIADTGAAGTDGGATSHRPIGGGTGVGGDPTQNPDGGAVPAGQIPPPLTEAEITSMSQAELQKALAAVSKARPYAKGNAELDERLKKEFTMLMDQLRKVKGGASS